jgi:hypothetical protein
MERHRQPSSAEEQPTPPAEDEHTRALRAARKRLYGEEGLYTKLDSNRPNSRPTTPAQAAINKYLAAARAHTPDRPESYPITDSRL